MTIALKIFAFLSATYVAYFDFTKISLMVQNPEVSLDLASYFFVPVGILFALFYFTGLMQKPIYKKIVSYLLMGFSGFHLLFKVLDLVLNLASNSFLDVETNYQGFLWVSQIIFLASVFILGLSFIKNNLRPLSAYVFVVSLVAYCLTVFYFVYASGIPVEVIFAKNSSFGFLIPQSLVWIGYTGIFFKEVWLENEILL